MFEDFGPNQCLAVSVLARTCLKLTHREMRKLAVPFLSFCVSQAHYAPIEDEAGPQKRNRPKPMRFSPIPALIVHQKPRTMLKILL